MPYLLAIPHRLLKITLVALVLAVVVFFALTHTEVGRDALRVQIEQQFAHQFDGSLTIGELRGNLIQDVFASDIRLEDGRGRLVGTIDSAVFRPNWRDLFDRTINSGKIELHRPRILLTFDEQGPNLAAIFRRAPEAVKNATPWSFRSADVRIFEGAIETANEGFEDDWIDRQFVFDYSRARADKVEGRALVQIGRDATILNLRSLSMDLQEPSFRIANLRGEIAVDQNWIDVRDLVIDAGGTAANLQAAIPYRRGSEPADVDLVMADARVDFDSLRILVPSLPLADRAVVSAFVHGTTQSLVIEQATLEHAATILNVSGTIVGMPEGVDYELAVDESVVRARDVETLLPGLELDRIRLVGSVAGSVYASGTVLPSGNGGRDVFSTEGSMKLSSPQGRVEGPFTIAGDSTSALDVTADLNVRRLLAHALIPEAGPDRSEINGRIRIDARHTDELEGEALARLSRSWIAGHALDSVSVDIVRNGGRTTGRGYATQAGSFAIATATYGDGELGADLQVRDLDAGRWWLRGDSVRTRMDARVAIDAVGPSLDALEGGLIAEVGESEIWHGGDRKVIPAHRHEATFRQSGTNPFLRIGGDVLELELKADAPLTSIRRGFAAWKPAISDALERELPRMFRSDALQTHHAPIASPVRVRVEPMRMTAQGRVIDSRILGIIYSDLASIGTDLALDAELNVGSNALALTAHVEGDSLVIGPTRLDGLRTDLHLAARRDSLGRAGTELRLDAASDSMVLLGRDFVDAGVNLDVLEGAGTIEAHSAGSSEGEALYMMASIDTFGGGRRVTFEDFRIAASRYEWTLDGRPAIDLFADAAVIGGLQMESMSSRSEKPQHIRIDGVLSSDPRDTLNAYIEHVRISEISDMLRMRYTIEGDLNGRVSLTGLAHQPELTGHLEVEEARFDGRPVGRVDVRSAYVAGEPDIRLDARIMPTDAFDAAPNNDLRLHGSVRLPVPGIDGRMLDPGRIDMRLEAGYVDAFFFDYIFSEISGARGVLSGSGAVRGDFRRPVFEADLHLAGGGMHIPDFNLTYDVDGAVTVDSTAIRLSGVNVHDLTGGTAVVDGDILFNEYRYFSFDLHAALDETQFMNVASSREMGFYGDVRASGNVSLTGPLDAATLSSSDAVLHPDSRIYIAIMEEIHAGDSGFIVFADSSGRIPDMSRRIRRRHVLSERPEGERMFVDGLEMDLNIFASQGTSVHLVIDPVLGDVINARASGRIQLLRAEGDYFTYGTLNVDSGDYLFTAGDVFVRRFLIDGGTIVWDGDPANAALDIQASYRTRASAAGLNLAGSDRMRIPLIVRMDVTGRVAAPLVGLRLLVDRDSRETITAYESLESILNQPERSAEYATSVMLTNSFMLTTSITSAGESGLAATRNQLAFNSLSQLVATQLNRYLSQTLPNVDVNLGLQGESTQDLDVTYGVALRLLDERLVIRGQGLYQNEAVRDVQQNLLDEFVVEVRVSSSVSVEVFYRRENDILASDHTLANTTGAGLSYETQFSSWDRLIRRIIKRDDVEHDNAVEDVLAGADDDAGRGE